MGNESSVYELRASTSPSSSIPASNILVPSGSSSIFSVAPRQQTVYRHYSRSSNNFYPRASGSPLIQEQGGYDKVRENLYLLKVLKLRLKRWKNQRKVDFVLHHHIIHKQTIRDQKKHIQ